jgi:paraquat-inducible protein B
MKQSQTSTEPPAELPEAKIRAKRRWKAPFVWVVPIVAAAVAGYLVFQKVREVGPAITITFKDAANLKAGQTQVQYRGVPLGDVTGVALSGDQKSAVIKVRLTRAAATIAREGSLFWVVSPKVGITSITGLGTIIGGPYIEVLPGSGAQKREFAGLDNPPVGLDRDSLKIVLLSDRLEAPKTGSPVYYRGVEVGAVTDCQLSTNAISVETHVFIRRRYAGLVRNGSKFWKVSGIDAKFGLFRGLEVNVESLKSLVVGGIEFATPENPTGTPAQSGAVFALSEDAQKDWLSWNPQIYIPPE